MVLWLTLADQAEPVVEPYRLGLVELNEHFAQGFLLLLQKGVQRREEVLGRLILCKVAPPLDARESWPFPLGFGREIRLVVVGAQVDKLFESGIMMLYFSRSFMIKPGCF